MRAHCIHCGYTSPTFQTRLEFDAYYSRYKHPWILLPTTVIIEPPEVVGICPNCMQKGESDEEFRKYVKKTVRNYKINRWLP